MGRQMFTALGLWRADGEEVVNGGFNVDGSVEVTVADGGVL